MTCAEMLNSLVIGPVMISHYFHYLTLMVCDWLLAEYTTTQQLILEYSGQMSLIILSEYCYRDCGIYTVVDVLYWSVRVDRVNVDVMRSKVTHFI